MQIINFDTIFFPALKDGSKTQTIRFGERHYPLGKAIAEFPGGEQVPIVITAVRVKQFSEVTQEEVVKDGFQDKEKLFQTLQSYYPIQEDSIVTLVEFEICSSQL